MKQFLIGLTVSACLSLPLSVAQAAPSLSADQVKSLNNAHTRIVRQAQRVCSVGPFTGIVRRGQSNGCIVGDVERHVRSLEDAAMVTFHQALPVRYRYSADRSFSQVQRYFQ